MQIGCRCCARLPSCVEQTEDQTIMQQSPTYTLFLYQFNKSKSKINKIVLSVCICFLFFIYSMCVLRWRTFRSRSKWTHVERRERWLKVSYGEMNGNLVLYREEKNPRRNCNLRTWICVQRKWIEHKTIDNSEEYSAKRFPFKGILLMASHWTMPTDSPTDSPHMHENGGTSTFTLFASSRFFMDRWVWIWE